MFVSIDLIYSSVLMNGIWDGLSGKLIFCSVSLEEISIVGSRTYFFSKIFFLMKSSYVLIWSWPLSSSYFSLKGRTPLRLGEFGSLRCKLIDFCTNVGVRPTNLRNYDEFLLPISCRSDFYVPFVYPVSAITSLPNRSHFCLCVLSLEGSSPDSDIKCSLKF